MALSERGRGFRQSGFFWIRLIVFGLDICPTVYYNKQRNLRINFKLVVFKYGISSNR